MPDRGDWQHRIVKKFVMACPSGQDRFRSRAKEIPNGSDAGQRQVATRGQMLLFGILCGRTVWKAL